MMIGEQFFLSKQLCNRWQQVRFIGRMPDGQVRYLVLTENITERKKMETHLIQVGKEVVQLKQVGRVLVRFLITDLRVHVSS
jgi:hypothetical protein